jgi:hypothetical protein
MRPTALTPRTTRRRLLGSVALAGPGFVFSASQLALAQEATPSAATSTPGDGAAAEAAGSPIFARVFPPDWIFTVHDYQDPLIGEVAYPEERPLDVRYIAADVQIDNASNQALEYSTGDIRLRGRSGMEYRPGGVAGTAPALAGRTLNPGERARGWVWFAVPVDEAFDQLVFVGPEPEFRVALTER